MKKHFYLLLLLTLFSACGELENRSLGDLDESIDPSLLNAFLLGTDYFSNAQLYTTTLDLTNVLSNSGVSSLGSDAIVKASGTAVYVLHRGGAFVSGSTDNVQILDPSNSFTTLNQWSTGNGTNPQDIVVEGNTAYISLADPTSDDDNVDESGNPGDILVMDLTTGSITKRISFFNFLNEDAYKNANANKLLLVGDVLYVLIQDLGESDVDPFIHNAQGKLGIINTTTNTIENVVTLTGRNPVGLAYSENEAKLFVSYQSPFDDFFTENLYASNTFGGLEIIPVNDTGNSVFVNDEDLGGYFEGVATGNQKLYLVVSHYDSSTFSFTSEIVSMDETNELADGLTELVSTSQDVRTMAVDALGHLWVSRRSINSDDGFASDPQVDVLDGLTGAPVGGPFVPDVPVVSIAFGE